MSRSTLIACALALMATPAMAGIATIPSANQQPIKFSVQNADPAHYTINLKKAANIGVNQKAKTFAMYNTASVPSRCADFTKVDINYQKPDKYHRIFDLTHNPEFLTAINQYGCVVIHNKPKLPPAKS